MRRKFLGRSWFFEDTLKLGESADFLWGVALKKNIFKGRSRFQNIEIFDTRDFGRVLVLDGLIQLSTKYEFVYHEMLAHPALFYHPSPKKILIIGGGDGGALREAVKHPVEEIFLVDIDKKVIEVSRKYLPSVSGGSFADKRVRIFNQDAVKFVKGYNDYFDVIINDSTDLYGPSACLWSADFYKSIRRALRPRGVAGFQTAYFKERFAQKARSQLKKIFPFFKLHRAYVGCFPFDECSFSFGSKNIDFSRISAKRLKQRYERLSLSTKYYSPRMHLASGIIARNLG